VDFNKEFFSLDKLRVSSLLFEQDKTIVLVKTFSNQEDAMKYYRSFASDDKVMADWTAEQFQLIVISRPNYTQLYRKKELEGYIDFFNSFYLTTE
ncbi:MAG: hypothetical protein ACI959_001578, partial [Limisphaerales bacterium]